MRKRLSKCRFVGDLGFLNLCIVLVKEPCTISPAQTSTPTVSPSLKVVLSLLLNEWYVTLEVFDAQSCLQQLLLLHENLKRVAMQTFGSHLVGAYPCSSKPNGFMHELAIVSRPSN